MVNYWLCITNEENWKVVKDRKIWGVPEQNRRQIAGVKPDDVLIFYVKPKKIAGIFKSITEPFKSDERIFSTTGFAERETFSHRISLEPKVVLKDPINFEQLVPKLNFLINKKKWGMHLMGKAMRSIPKEDYEVIESSIRGI